MSSINDVNLGSHYETTVKPIWKLKPQIETISAVYLNKKADDIQVDGTHYKDMAIQPWEVMETILTHEEFVGFLKGNFIKYSMRIGKKEGANHDAEKARHYKAKLNEIKSVQCEK